KLSIARLWRRVVKTMVRLVCARNTTRHTMQLSSLVRTGTTSKWFATNPRPNHSIEGTCRLLHTQRICCTWMRSFANSFSDVVETLLLTRSLPDPQLGARDDGFR